MAVVPVVLLWPRSWIVRLKETYSWRKQYSICTIGGGVPGAPCYGPHDQGQCWFSPLCLECPPCLSGAAMRHGD